jgi:hypothetical protein
MLLVSFGFIGRSLKPSAKGGRVLAHEDLVHTDGSTLAIAEHSQQTHGKAAA